MMINRISHVNPVERLKRFGRINAEDRDASLIEDTLRKYIDKKIRS